MKTQGMEKNVAEGLAALERMEQASLSAPQIGLDTLMSLIRANENTEYGKKYGFRDIHSYADYARKVPFSEYKDYEPYIERMLVFGEKNLITASDVLYYAHTSGTSGASKMIPRTQQELEILYNDIFQRAFGLCEKENAGGEKAGGEKTVDEKAAGEKENAAIAEGRFSGSRGANFMETQIGFTSMGIPHGAISATLNHPEDTVPCSVFPEEIIYSTVDFDRRHVKLLFALREKHLSFLMSTFSPMIHDMIVYLQLHWQELCGDLEAGRVGAEVSVDPRMRARLNAILTPDPERAEEIRGIMQKYKDGDFIPRIWPDLKLVACVGTATFAPHLEKIKEHLGPDIAVDQLGYVSSESTVAAQIKEGRRGLHAASLQRFL